MKILSVVGARPQYVKAAGVSRELRHRHREVLVDTGQHYDLNVSDVFIRELEMPQPDHNLGVGSGSHSEHTARIMLALDPVAASTVPDAMLIFGDTNSTVPRGIGRSRSRRTPPSGELPPVLSDGRAAERITESLA